MAITHNLYCINLPPLRGFETLMRLFLGVFILLNQLPPPFHISPSSPFSIHPSKGITKTNMQLREANSISTNHPPYPFKRRCCSGTPHPLELSSILIATEPPTDRSAPSPYSFRTFPCPLHSRYTRFRNKNFAKSLAHH